jgi:hypothetical protein
MSFPIVMVALSITVTLLALIPTLLEKDSEY